MATKLLLALALLAAAPLARQAGEGQGFDHEHVAWTAILKAHARGDRFDYKALKESPGPLDAYLKTLHEVTPANLRSWKKEQRHAFWINAYNAHTIKKVVGGYPVDSIRDLSGLFGLRSVFDEEFIPMRAHHPEGDDDDLSLNDIEHGILRPVFKDARVHAAVNCASIGCPPLRNEAFTASKLDEQMNAQMRAFVTDPLRNRFDRAKGEVKVSEIFKWFEEDFKRDAGSVRAYLIRYSPQEDEAFLRQAGIRFLEYDWDLNDVKR